MRRREERDPNDEFPGAVDALVALACIAIWYTLITVPIPADTALSIFRVMGIVGSLFCLFVLALRWLAKIE